MTSIAPIIIFTYKRPEHMLQTLMSLSKNKDFLNSPLFIYCDGARHPDELAKIEEVRQLVNDWPHPNKTVIKRDRNWGLANSVIDGVTTQCATFGKVIVIEDDLVVSPHFLKYMNTALDKYQHDDRVISIHGYSYPINGLPEAFFIKGTSSWGWATWKRGWDLFEADGQKIYDELQRKKLMYRFNILGSYPYKRMLNHQIYGLNDSWAIRWYGSALLRDKLTLHPGISLVSNIGLDGTGEHCDLEPVKAFPFSKACPEINLEVKESEYALDLWSQYLKKSRREKLFRILTSKNLLITVAKRALNRFLKKHC